MNFPQAVKSAFSKYIQFNGRSLRSEFWYFTLFIVIGQFIATVPDAMIYGTAWLDYMDKGETGIVERVFALVTFVPSIAVTARRLHDINRSGWWMLIAFTLIGIIPLIYWNCKAGDPQHNKFGPVISIT